jgi:hypothetical protein
VCVAAAARLLADLPCRSASLEAGACPAPDIHGSSAVPARGYCSKTGLHFTSQFRSHI